MRQAGAAQTINTQESASLVRYQTEGDAQISSSEHCVDAIRDRFWSTRSARSAALAAGASP
ncbi:MAG: hypothetical protein Q8R59_16605 [Polaromonas sp.]|nr:hypothetical protein [Polaromonas sp.]